MVTSARARSTTSPSLQLSVGPTLLDAAGIDRLVTSYLTDPMTGALRVFDVPDGQLSSPPTFPSGGAGLVSTADDFMAFAQMLLRGGAPLLSRSSVGTMTSNHVMPQQRAIGGFFPGDLEACGWGFEG